MRRPRNLALVKRIIVLALVLLLGIAAPPMATAQFGGPTDVPAPLTQPPDDQTDATPFEDDTGLSTVQLVLIFGAAIAMIAFIAWFIMRDAHRAAPAAERGRRDPAKVGAGTGGSPKAKSAREREREKARKRSKAKQVRQQRKRNRPR